MNPDKPPCEVRMSFQDDEETLLVTPMGPNLYRMEESSVLGEVSYHDVIEAELQTDGTVRFLRVLTPSGLTTVSWILSQTLLESPALSALLEKVMAVGGNWERIFGGVLLLHLPPTEHDLIVGEFNNLFNQLPTNGPSS
jgi:hypothetical protein